MYSLNNCTSTLFCTPYFINIFSNNSSGNNSNDSSNSNSTARPSRRSNNNSNNNSSNSNNTNNLEGTNSSKVKGNDTSGRTVLMITCINGHIDIVNMLIDRGKLSLISVNIFP